MRCPRGEKGVALLQAAATFGPENRKYIGSKVRLLPFLTAHISAVAPRMAVFADPFAGTGVVAHHFAPVAERVVAGDCLYSNYSGLRTFLEYDGTPGEAALHSLIAELNALPPAPGYCAAHYGGTYFTPENAGRIDAVRNAIARWRQAGQIDAWTEAALITALLYAADKVANTVGQYDAYLKHLGETPYAADGTHRVDACVYQPLTLAVPRLTVHDGRHLAFCGDAADLLRDLEGDVLYLDPPYNTRQYIDNYHVLENIALWLQPPLYGVTRKFDRSGRKSPFSLRRAAGAALAALVAQARFQHVFLSYNCEGILSLEEIVALLRPHGAVEVFETEYAVFGNGAGQSRKRPVRERLYYLRKQGV